MTKIIKLIKPEIFLIFLLLILYVTSNNLIATWLLTIVTLISKYVIDISDEKLNVIHAVISSLVIGPEGNQIVRIVRASLDFLVGSASLMVLLSLYFSKKPKIGISRNLTIIYSLICCICLISIIYDGFLSYMFFGGVYFKLKGTFFFYGLISLYMVLFVSTLYNIISICYKIKFFLYKVILSLILLEVMFIVINSTFMLILSSKMGVFYFNYEVLEDVYTYSEIISCLLNSYVPYIQC